MKNKGLLQTLVTNVTSEAPLPSHVFKRSSTYYFRRVVPEALRPYFLTNSGKLRTEVKGGIWIIKITPDAGSTKTGRGREVPIHTHLIEIGILTLAKAGSEKPIFYDPVRLRGAKAENRPYQKVGERLAAWVRSIGVTDSEVAPNHGWRHLFKTIGNSAGIPETAMNAIQGHAPRNEAERYGSWTVSALMSEIAKIPRFRTTEE